MTVSSLSAWNHHSLRREDSVARFRFFTRDSRAVRDTARLTIPMYQSTIVTMPQDPRVVERVQTGVRLEKRLLKVLKALAEFHDMTLGDLLEGIVLHAFEGKCAFQPDTLRRIAVLKKFYGLDLDAGASHRLMEGVSRERSGAGRRDGAG